MYAWLSDCIIAVLYVRRPFHNFVDLCGLFVCLCVYVFNRFAHPAGPEREASKLLGVYCTDVAGACVHIEADSRSHAINVEKKPLLVRPAVPANFELNRLTTK